MTTQAATQRSDAVLRPEHLLFAMAREGNCVGATVLTRLGVDLTGVAASLDEELPRNAEGAAPESPMKQLKAVIEAAIAEARDLGHQYIGTEHLLLGLVRTGQGRIAEIFAQNKITPETARAAVLKALAESR
jgi:ATP-dependent Clp protease ATP-binding subunit ClpC